jgi:hypothetical protein
LHAVVLQSTPSTRSAMVFSRRWDVHVCSGVDQRLRFRS